jgi:pimeloyl-ACP methyl ester carboxylesterase
VTTTLLMLPGHMCDRRLWQWVEPTLSAAGYGVAHADITGHDSIAGIAAALLAAAPPRFVAIGLSMGGIVAFELMRQAPGRIEGLILCDTNPAGETPEREIMRHKQQDSVRHGQLSTVVKDELKPAYLAPHNRERSDLLDVTYRMAMELGPDVFLRQSQALLARLDSTSMLRQIACPTLVLCGAEDPVCPPRLHRGMALAIPGAALKLINGAGHLPPLEQPALFAAAILQWLSNLAAGQQQT